MKKARRYNKGKRKWSLLYFPAIEELIKVMEFGAFKYTIFRSTDPQMAKSEGDLSGADLIKGLQDDGVTNAYETAVNIAESSYKVVDNGKNNWKNGLGEENILESAMRHLVAMMKGEDYDKESKIHHGAHAMANLMFLLYYRDHIKNN